MKNDQSPFYYLQQQHEDMAQFLGKHAQPIVPKEHWTGLCFNSDDILFAADVGGVHAVISPRKISPLPRQRKAIIGLGSFKGQVLPIVDLKKIFWHQESKISHYSKIIIYQYQENFWGVLVCKVEGLRRFESENFESVDLAPEIPYSPFVNRVYFQDQQRCARLDLKTFISKIYEL